MTFGVVPPICDTWRRCRCKHTPRQDRSRMRLRDEKTVDENRLVCPFLFRAAQLHTGDALSIAPGSVSVAIAELHAAPHRADEPCGMCGHRTPGGTVSIPGHSATPLATVPSAHGLVVHRLGGARSCVRAAADPSRGVRPYFGSRLSDTGHRVASHDSHRSAVGHQAAVRYAPSLDVEKLRTRSRSNFAPHHVAIVCRHGSSHCALLPDDCMALLAYQPCDCGDMASFTPGLRDRSSGRPRLLPVLTVNARSTTRKVQGVTTPKSGLSVSGPFVCRCLIIRTVLRFHIPLIEPDMRC